MCCQDAKHRDKDKKKKKHKKKESSDDRAARKLKKLEKHTKSKGAKVMNALVRFDCLSSVL